MEKIGTSTLQKNCIKICSTFYTALHKVVKEVTAQLLRSIYQQHCCVTRFNQQLSKFNLWGLSNVLALRPGWQKSIDCMALIPEMNRGNMRPDSDLPFIS